MKKWKTNSSRILALVLGCLVIFAAGEQVHAVNFTGADPSNNFLSTTNNWDTFPVNGGAVFYVNGTSATDPAQVDAAFTTYLGNTTLAPLSGGTAYMEVLDGATNKLINLWVGHSTGGTRGAQLTLNAGSVLMSYTANSGTLNIGLAGAGALVAKDGADFSFSSLNLGANGTLTYELGTNSVSTFVSTKNNAAAPMVLNGVIAVDLAAGPAAGTNALIECSHASTTLTGTLATWLSGQGGSFSSTGSYAGSNFKVLNGGNTGWTLRLSGNTLEFVVDVQGHYLSDGASQDTTLRSSGAQLADLGGATQMFVHLDDAARGLLEFDLSGADFPITNAILTLTQTTTRTGEWTFNVYPMVYTANNYSWYEGTGTNIFANNTQSPAASTGAACYQYRQGDATTPLAWEDESGSPLGNAGNAALWGAAIGSTTGTDSVVGRQLTFELDAAALETFRTNGVGRITIGVWGPSTLDGNHLLASKEYATAGWRPRIELLMEGPPPPLVAPDITSLSVGPVGDGSNAVAVVFDAAASASLWFTPNLVSPTWTNVVSGASPLAHTNDTPAGFYKVTIP
ncbi:MAG: hypothetical protein K9M54_05835 [Kiritimatiellales bacterium]|nr:hypothetical protein [Kiritimatiellales bacterium]